MSAILYNFLLKSNFDSTCDYLVAPCLGQFASFASLAITISMITFIPMIITIISAIRTNSRHENKGVAAYSCA